MKNYSVRLESKVFETFRSVRAANSLDINTAEKAVHALSINADIESPFSVGLIVGASGSGKTTLAKQIYGEDAFREILDPNLPVIEQFPKDWEYPRCAEALAGMGLTSVPCWIREAKTLSNGQRARAEAALQIARAENSGRPVVLDEWTSVVDRTVAKVMSHCVQKWARKTKTAVVLLSCHYDVADWLDPDWVIDCNTQEFTDRRSLRPEDRRRKEQLEFSIREIGKESWSYFSKYHYLSAKLAGGKNVFYGLFHVEQQVGFCAYTNYVPKKMGQRIIFHSNRVVIHPDYAGMGLGAHFVNETAALLKKRQSCEVYSTFSSVSMFNGLIKSRFWKLLKTENRIGVYKNPIKTKGGRGSAGFGKGGFRQNVKLFVFKHIGGA